MQFIMLKSGDSFRVRNELRFWIHFFQVPFILLHKEKHPTVFIDKTDIGFRIQL